MQVTCRCGERFQSKPAPCPDGREGCCVAHYDKASFVCPTCGYDSGPDIAKAILGGNVVELPGIAIVNERAVKEIEFALDKKE
jgi:hypothetical protein